MDNLLRSRARLNIHAAGLGFNLSPPIGDAAYTPVAEDSIDSFLEFESASPQVITLEAGVHTAGDIMRFYRGGSGTVEIVAGGGVTIIGNDDGGGNYFIDPLSFQMVIVDTPDTFRLVSAGGGSGASTLAALTDVTITVATDGHALVYDTGEWINRFLTESDITDLHTHSNKANLDTIDQNLATTDEPEFSRVTSTNQAVNGNELVRLDQLNAASLGLHWIFAVDDRVDFTTAEPSSPTSGDRYINTVTGNGSITFGTTFTQHYVYEWNGSSWTEFVPVEGWAVWDKAADENLTFNATEWVQLGTTTAHNLTTGLQGGTTNEYYHLTSTQHASIGNWDTAYSWGDHAGLYALINHTHGNLDVWRKSDGLTSADSYTEQIHHLGNVVLNGATKDGAYNNAFGDTFLEGNLGISGIITSENTTSWLTIRGNQGLRLEQVNQNVGHIAIGSTSLSAMAANQSGDSNVIMARNWLVSGSNTVAPVWKNLTLASIVDYSGSVASNNLGEFISIKIDPTLVNVGIHYALDAIGEFKLRDFPNTRDNGVLVNYLGTDANGVLMSGQISDLLGGGVNTGLELISEGGNTGWRLIGKDPANYGDIGEGAVDLSESSGASSVRGATGDYSFATGLDVQVSSDQGSGFGTNNILNVSAANSLVSGNTNVVNSPDTIASGDNLTGNGASSALFNSDNTTEGNSTLVSGLGNTAWSLGETVVGTYATDYSRAGAASTWDSDDRIFTVGVGSTDLSRADAFIVLKSGLLTAPSMTMVMIDNGPDDVLITKEWFLANDQTGTAGGEDEEGLEMVTENLKTGWRLVGKDPANYGDTGEGAVTMSESDIASTTRGATGDYSLSTNFNTTASGLNSSAFNFETIASGDNSTAFGDTTIASGDESFTAGVGSQAQGDASTSISYYGVAASFGEVVFGFFPTTYAANSTTSFNVNDRVLVVGMGTGSGTRADALVVMKSGLVTVPSQTTALIDSPGNDKAVLTKEWYVDNNIGDHTFLTNIGTNTHDQIDSHIADTTIHFTQAEISITESQISDFNSSLYQLLSEKGVADGYASLDSSGLVPASQLPSYVDDVLEFADEASFPGTGETGKIYVALDTNETFRWSGSVYIEIASGAVQSVNGQDGIVVLDTDDISEGSINLWDKVVSFTGGTNVTIGGTYPNFTITDNSANAVHTHLISEVTDITATASELNLLDLSGLTVGWALLADSPTTASWQAIPVGATTFLGLSDSDPVSYVGSEGYLVRVNSTPDGLEFVDGSLLYASVGHTHSSYNRSTLDLSGGSVFSDIVVVDGIITGMSVRTMTAGDIGVTSNIPTSLSIGTITGTTFGITSDGGTDDVVLPEANTTQAGLLGAGKWNEIVANSLKVSFPGWGSITDHTDVVSAANTNRFVLVANGTTGYVGRALVEADISDFGSYSVVGHTHLLATGATDVTATAAEVNLLDLSGLTAGWVLSADSATTASWKAPTSTVSELIDLSDVTVSTPTNGFMLIANGATFESRALLVSDISDWSSVEGYITDAPTIALLENTANWSVDGAYTGTAITGTFQGQKHYNNSYFFEAYDDNSWLRLPRG